MPGLYGLKANFSVLSNRIATFCTNHFPGSVSYIKIMTKNISTHESLSKKTNHKRTFEDLNKHDEIHPIHRAMFYKKGYQGASEFLRIIQARKRVSNRSLPCEQEKFNSSVNSDLMLVVNYFRRLSTFWNISLSKYEWSHSI